MLIDDFYARLLVRHTRLPGRLRLMMLPSAKRLERSGRIAAARRIQCDGACIDVWVVSPPDNSPHGNVSRPAVLLIHGLWDSKALMLPTAERLAAEGFRCVLPDVRCHGRSSGKFVTYGYREKEDLATVMRSLAAEGLVGEELLVLGFSAGGVIATQFAAIWPRCRGLMLLAPVADARMIMRRMLKVVAPLKGEAACRRIIDRAGEIAGFDVDAASAIEAARHVTCPAVVVHGMMDRTVPPSHGRTIFEALAGPKQFVPVWWAGHNSLWWGRSGWIVRQLVEMAEKKRIAIGE